MWTTMKSYEMQLYSKANFSLILHFNCSNFRIKQCERHLVLPKLSKKLSLKGPWAS